MRLKYLFSFKALSPQSSNLRRLTGYSPHCRTLRVVKKVMFHVFHRSQNYCVRNATMTAESRRVPRNVTSKKTPGIQRRDLHLINTPCFVLVFRFPPLDCWCRFSLACLSNHFASILSQTATDVPALVLFPPLKSEINDGSHCESHHSKRARRFGLCRDGGGTCP